MDHRQPNSNNSDSSPMSIPALPDEIIAHIISNLSVKEILRLKTVCKSWNTFLSDSSFIKMHLNKSTPRPTMFLEQFKYVVDSSVLPFPTRILPPNMSAPFPRAIIVGSCNGLLCFRGFEPSLFQDKYYVWFRFWNPATQKISEIVGTFRRDIFAVSLKIAFGYDNLTDTYKIVAMHLYDGYTSSRNEVNVFGLGDNVWRSLPSFPAIPLGYCDDDNPGVYLNGTLNWMAFHNNSGSIYWNWKTISVKQIVIVSLDLGTETYTQLLPPKGFDAVPFVAPIICTIMDCLCFVHDVKDTHLVIWKMLEFGVEKSWTQYFKINYQNIPNGNIDLRSNRQLLPLCLSENGDALILSITQEIEAILYYWNDNRTERIKIPNSKWRHWHYYVMDYVESMAPIG